MQSLAVLKATVGIPGSAVEIDDETVVGLPAPRDTFTAWDVWLSRAQLRAAARLEGWGVDTQMIDPPENLLDAETLLVRAEIIMEHGVVTALTPTEIQVAGQSGQRTRFRAVTIEERDALVCDLRHRAQRIVTGESPFSDFAGAF